MKIVEFRNFKSFTTWKSWKCGRKSANRW